MEELHAQGHDFSGAAFLQKPFDLPLGVGIAAFLFTTPTSTANSEVHPGLNALAGLRGFMTEHVALFGEYKFNYANGTIGSLKSDYRANMVMFGEGYISNPN